MKRKPEQMTAMGIAWGRLDLGILRTLADLARSESGDQRIVRVDLELDVQGTPTIGSVRAKGKVRAFGPVTKR